MNNQRGIALVGKLELGSHRTCLFLNGTKIVLHFLEFYLRLLRNTIPPHKNRHVTSKQTFFI